jgi:hypothetical protein
MDNGNVIEIPLAILIKGVPCSTNFLHTMIFYLETLPNNCYMHFEIGAKTSIFGNNHIFCWELDVYIQFYGFIWQQQSDGNFPWTY